MEGRDASRSSPRLPQLAASPAGDQQGTGRGPTGELAKCEGARGEGVGAGPGVKVNASGEIQVACTTIQLGLT